MKKLYLSSMIMSITIIVLSSCTTTNNVTSDGLIQKRKFRKGYYVQNPFYNSKKQNALANNDINKSDEPINEFKIVTTGETNNRKVLLASDDDSLIAYTQTARAIDGIKGLYKSDIKDIKTFKREYNNIKKDVRDNFISKAFKGKYQSEKPGEGEGSAYAITSFVLAVVGLVFAGIICGLFAFIFGIMGLNGKLKGLAIAGIILGLIDIIGVLLYLSTL